VIKQYAHLCIISTNAANLVTFYNEMLGLPTKFTMKNNDGVEFGYYIDCGGTTFLEIFDRDLKCKMWGGTPDDLTKGNTYSHFCLQVTDLSALRDELIAKGVDVTSIVEGMDHSNQAWIDDPDGNRIELMEYTARSKQVQ